jgi:hypothetical protein
MAAFVTDQFRILNASNFVDSVSDENNSYYAFLGLSNPTAVGFGRTSDWDTNVPSPIDNFQYSSHYKDTALFGKKITSSNARRVIRKVEWTANTAYDMYRHDYSNLNPTPVSGTLRLYDANYYIITSEFKVFICIDNGSSGTNTPNRSLYEPTSTQVEPSQAGLGDDGYLWKYLFTISPSDIIKFDSTQYVALPNDWSTSTNTDIETIREGGDYNIQPNQIKKVYVENGGTGYDSGTYNIIGDGSGAQVSLNVSSGVIQSVDISSGGSGYTFGVVDLSSNPGTGAKLIPIIPPSRGHGYDIYKELGADRVLMYARFDDSTKDFPIDTKFSQIGIIKNPEQYSSQTIYSGNTFSSLYSIVLTSIPSSFNIGDEITQIQGTVTAKGYVASIDSETKVLKYYQDRSLAFSNGYDQQDSDNNTGLYEFNNNNTISFESGGSANVDSSVSGSTITIDNKLIDLGSNFTNGLANPEINNKTGDIIYIDNRPVVERDSRQKEDIKIILEF